ncbi:MAG TPA: hypothetical protein VMD59_14810 [Acidimicrobiales bacterium]|nr:hypothetical protein [Acidimicrobiales bacterium]
MQLVCDAALAAGRDAAGVSASVQIAYAACCAASEVEEVERAVLAAWAGLGYTPLAVNPSCSSASPAGSPTRCARERFGLSEISLGERDDVALAPAAPLELCRRVVPLLDGEVTRCASS